jgi:hypothetical protein
MHTGPGAPVTVSDPTGRLFALAGSGPVSNDETEIREVVSDDPSLSPAANRILTEEARQAIGADRVRVPRDTPHAERERHGDHSTIGEAFAANRILISITFFALLVVGAIAALATDSWWAVVVAATVHAVGTFAVLTTLASVARQVEHVSLAVAAFVVLMGWVGGEL